MPIDTSKVSEGVGVVALLVAIAASVGCGNHQATSSGADGSTDLHGSEDAARYDESAEPIDAIGAVESPPSVEDGSPDALAVDGGEASVAVDLGADPSEDLRRDSGGDTAHVDGGLDVASKSPEGVPRISMILPGTVFAGDAVAIVGADFTSDSVVRFGATLVAPTSVMLDRITVAVPRALPLSSCLDNVPVSVETQAGTSSSVELQVKDPGPTLSPPPPSQVRAGSTVVLTGCGLGDAQVYAGNIALVLLASTDTMLSVAVPGTAPSGAAVLTVLTSRGRTESQIAVLPPLAPVISELSPSMLVRGESLTILGSNLSLDPHVRIGTTPIEPHDVTPIRLTLTVPATLPLASCLDSLPVTVETDGGTSVGVPLVVKDPGPSLLSGLPSQVRAGAVLTVSGCGLANAQISLGGVGLQSASQSDTAVTVLVPREVAAGTAALSVSTAAGPLQSKTVTILPPLPRVLSSDLPTVGPGGILEVTTDLNDITSLQAVTIGSASIPVTESSSFKWLPSTMSGQRTFAIRAPNILATGSLQVAIVGAFGTSDGYSIAGVKPPPVMPPATSGIVLPPANTAAETFPTGITTPFSGVDPTTSSYNSWIYDLRIKDAGGDGACIGLGSVKGLEKLLLCAGQSPCGGNGGPSGCSSAVFGACHPIDGSFQVGPGTNTMSVTIDRTTSGGTVESYIGGWVQLDGTTPVDTSTPLASALSAYLVLRSQSTGIALAIRHQVKAQCDH